MGNIKHNDELLRVHDDGFDVVFNCDNKHQNGVSYHAEKNGKKTKIDPEYAMAALVKKVSGAGWPADLPAPSAGGYGYTEQESRVAFEGNTDPSGGWEYEMESSEPVLEVGKTYTVVIDDDEYANLTAAADEWGGVVIGDRSYADYPFMISAYPYAIYIYLDPSIYARGTTYSIKIESTEETIHKINEKYLPEISPTDEVLENAKETGGIGWTKEIKEATTIVDGTFYCAGGNDSVELTNEYSLVEGQSYNVTFNGTEYNNLVAFDDGGLISIGGTYGEYNEYPFHIENGENSPYPLKFYTEMPGNYSLVITTILEGEVIHKIDEKYLPESGGMMVVNVSYNSDTEVYSIDRPFSEISASMPNVVANYDNAIHHLQDYAEDYALFTYYSVEIDEHNKIPTLYAQHIVVDNDDMVVFEAGNGTFNLIN